MDSIKKIIEILEKDALEPDKEKRFYELSDKDLLAILSNLKEFELPKVQRAPAVLTSKPPKLNY